MFLLVVGLSSVAATAYFGYKEYYATKKRSQLIQYVDYLTKDMQTEVSIRDAGLIGAGSTVVSVFSVYAALEQHREVLDIMQYRYPNELMDMSPLDWLAKVETLYAHGDQALNGFISGYTGQAAENITVEQFEAMGATASLFENRTHANDDIRITMDGETLHYSVKSYANSDSFTQAISNHPESTHYVVNKELYRELEEKGLLQQYEAQGITIMEGNYSHVALREEASKAFFDIHAAAEAADYIPFISAPLFVFRSGFNVKAFREGKQSGHELAVNVASDAGKLGAASGLGFGGAKLGGILGTALFPGIGTVIGGGLGAVIGAFTGSKLMDSIKTYLKWGKIIEVQEQIGHSFSDYNLATYKQHYLNTLFSINQVEQKLVNSRQLTHHYEGQLDVYNFKKVSLTTVLHQMFVEHISFIRDGLHHAASALPSKIDHFAEQCAKKIKKPKAKYAFIGELLLQEKERYLLPEDKELMRDKIEQYEKERQKYPHYPYQFQLPASEILEQITAEALNEHLQPKQNYSFLNQNKRKYQTHLFIFTILSILAFASYLYR